MYNELHMENMLEIGRVIQSMFDEDKLEHYDSKEVFMDALSWAEEFEDQYDEGNDYYYDAIDEFVRQKIEDKFKEYYEDNG